MGTSATATAASARPRKAAPRRRANGFASMKNITPCGSAARPVGRMDVGALYTTPCFSRHAALVTERAFIVKGNVDGGTYAKSRPEDYERAAESGDDRADRRTV